MTELDAVKATIAKYIDDQEQLDALYNYADFGVGVLLAEAYQRAERAEAERDELRWACAFFLESGTKSKSQIERSQAWLQACLIVDKVTKEHKP